MRPSDFRLSLTNSRSCIATLAISPLLVNSFAHAQLDCAAHWHFTLNCLDLTAFHCIRLRLL